MKKLYFFILILLPLFSGAQDKHGQSLLDSLLDKLSSSADDTSKVILLDHISYAYSNINPDEGLKYAERTKQLAQKLKWEKGVASAYAEMGINYSSKSNHDSALRYHHEALKLYERLNDKNGASAVTANISLVYMSQSNYPKALEYAFKALSYGEDNINKHKEATILENIGTIYLEQKNYSKTMEYYIKAFKAYEKLNDKKGMARNMGNTGIVMDAQGDYPKALEYHLRALKTNRELGDMNSVQINLANVGYVYCHMRNFSEALNYQIEALGISQELGLKSSIAINTGNIGETYFAIANDDRKKEWNTMLIPKGKEANLQLAVKNLEKAIALCKEINFAGPQIEFSQYLSDAYLLSGNHKKAFEAYKEFAVLKEEVYSQQNKIEMTKLETQRALDLKNKDIIIKDKEIQIGQLNAANKRNERVIYISGIFLLLAVIFFTVRKYILRSRKHKTVLADIAQVQAHEIRGPVATIQGLAQLFNYADPADPVNKELLGYITVATSELDAIVKKVVDKTY